MKIKGYNLLVSRKKKTVRKQKQELPATVSLPDEKPSLWPLIILATTAGLFLLFIFGSFTPSTNTTTQQTAPATTPSPTASAIPTPTIDPDPLVDCIYPSACGGKKLVRNSVCDTTTCCKLKTGFKVMKSAECREAVQKEIDAKFDELSKELSKPLPTPNTPAHPLPDAFPTYNFVIATSAPRPTYNDTYKAPVNNSELYQQCMDRVSASYQTNIANGMYLTGAENIRTGGESDCLLKFKSSTPF